MRVFTAGIAALVLVACVDAHAIGSLTYKNPEERAFGVGGALWAFARSPSKRAATLVEAGQRYPFEIPDLAAKHLRIGSARGSWCAVLSGVVLTSPVGKETFTAFELSFRHRQWALAVAGEHRAAALDGAGRSDALTASVVAQARAGEFAFGYRIEGYHIAGERIPGADTSVYVVALPDEVLSVCARMELRRNGSVAMLVAGRLRLGRFAGAAFGYEDGAESLNASLGVGVAGVGIDVGASLHPVLGLSQSVFVWWRR